MKISHWQVHNPHGELVVSGTRSRWDALTTAVADTLALVKMSYTTQLKLMNLCNSEAGWSKIEADGWIISPVMAKEVRRGKA